MPISVPLPIEKGGTNAITAGQALINLGASPLSAAIFQNDIPVTLSPGRTFGKYANGEVIPATGKTAEEVFRLALTETLPPTASLTSNTTIAFNQTSISNILSFEYLIRNLGASVSIANLDWKRGNETSWILLSSLTLVNMGTVTHNTTIGNFETQPFNYRLVITDTQNSSVTATRNLSIATYGGPSVSNINVGGTTKYRGNTNTTYTATLTRNSPNVPITSYELQRSIDEGSSWTSVGSPTSVSGNPGTISINITDTNNSIPSVLNATELRYRIRYTDSFQTALTVIASSNVTINLVHRQAVLFNSNENITVSDIDNASNFNLTNANNGTYNSITAGAGLFTFYVYNSASPNLTSILLSDGGSNTQIIGAFTGPTIISGTNINGVQLGYKVYKSNATAAFTNNTLIFS
jgi:hypothetical protein